MTGREYKEEKMVQRRFFKMAFLDRLILFIGYVLLALFVLAIVIPLVYVVAASFMDPTTLQNKGISFDLSSWTLTAYERVLSNGRIWRDRKSVV